MLKGKQTLTKCPQGLRRAGCPKIENVEQKKFHSRPTFCIRTSAIKNRFVGQADWMDL
jgi:hypothetical protein